MASSNSFEVSDSIHSLQSAQQAELLNKVDSLRAEGLSEFTNLPQLVVCGDQSSGKSSVLAAISGIPFQAQDALCTRFATEVILRRAQYESISVSIVPAPESSPSDRERLLSFRHEFKSRGDFKGLFKAATALITASRTFSKDVLRVEFCGPAQPQLTLVDLPGVIHSDSDSEASGNVELVSDLVDSYLKNPRSVILAVVSAKNDISNQAVLRKARIIDPGGLRTLGIITKPDKLDRNSTSEAAFINLARNKQYIFDLGWHVIKNLDFAITEPEHGNRDEEESSFFRESNFRNLPPHTVGIAALRTRLSKVLFNQIRIELPKLIMEIESRISSCRIERERLGPGRNTVEEQKEFLIDISQSFQAICRDGVRGDYDHSFFHSDTNSARRLCADLMNKHFEFAKVLRENGARWKIVNQKRDAGRDRTREEAITEACKLLKRSRGRELPGLPNPLLVGELFREYSRPWKNLAEKHIDEVWQVTCTFLELVLQHLTDGDVSNAILRLFLLPKMEDCQQSAHSKLSELLAVHKDQPMTTNCAFVDNRKKFQLQGTKDELKEKFGAETTGSRQIFTLNDVTRVLDSLGQSAEPDMDMVAAEDAFDNMNAFYQVALNLFTDNVPSLAIQAPVIREVPGLFCPNVVFAMDAELVTKIAGESEEKIRERNELQRQLTMLESGLRICKQYTMPLHHVSGTPDQHDPLSRGGADSVGKNSQNELFNNPRVSTATLEASNTPAEQADRPSVQSSNNSSEPLPDERDQTSAVPLATEAPTSVMVTPSPKAPKSQPISSFFANLPNQTTKIVNFNDPLPNSNGSPAPSGPVFGSSTSADTVEWFGSAAPSTGARFSPWGTVQKEPPTPFGSSNSTAPHPPPSVSLFGSLTSAEANAAFGGGSSSLAAPSTTPNPFPSSAAFGKEPVASSALSGFGSPQPPFGSTGTLFGGVASQSTAKAKPALSFGSSGTSAPSAGRGIFGGVNASGSSSSTVNVTTSSLFGSTTHAADNPNRPSSAIGQVSTGSKATSDYTDNRTTSGGLFGSSFAPPARPNSSTEPLQAENPFEAGLSPSVPDTRATELKPMLQKEASSGINHSFQTISSMPPFSRHSFEELRLADYRAAGKL